MAKEKKKQVKEKPVKKTEPTLKEKIDKVVDEVSEIDEKNRVELKKNLFILFQRVLYPDQFCPKCDERLFFNPTGWSCPNCGYIRQPNQTTTQPTARPSQTGKVPPQVEKMIENTQEPRRVVSPTKKGQSIRKLVDQMDTGGSSAPTPQDEARVRRDRNVSRDINWV